MDRLAVQFLDRLAEPVQGVGLAIGWQRIVDAGRPAVLLERGEDRLLVTRRLSEALNNCPAQAQFAAVAIPDGIPPVGPARPGALVPPPGRGEQATGDPEPEVRQDEATLRLQTLAARALEATPCRPQGGSFQKVLHKVLANERPQVIIVHASIL